MSNKIIPVLALLLAAGVQTSQAQTEDEGGMPQLRVIQMTGEINVKPSLNPNDKAGRNTLPYIMPGTQVRVVSGTALFQTDSQATITATEGDEFLFTARPRQGDTSPAMSIKAVGKETSLHLSFGGKRYLLRENGLVDVSYDAEGETTVTVGGGHVALLPGSFLHAGESITVSTSNAAGSVLSPGDQLVARQSKDRGFESLPVNFSSLNITEGDDNTFSAKTVRPEAYGQTAGTGNVEQIIASWPTVSRLTAGFLIEKYGAPNEVASNELTWVDNAPWKKTMVHKEGLLRTAPRRIVHQTVSYDVPRARVAALESMDMGLKADRGRKELSVASESEEANFLALNLANDVITGRITVQDAKDAFERTLTLAAAGKSSPYTEGLSFETR